MICPNPHRIIVVGGSAGGLEALRELVASLPEDLAAPVLVVLHIPATARSHLAAILGRGGSLPVVTAEHRDPLVAGTVVVAPPDHHLLVGRRHVMLSHGPKEKGSRPAIDPLFRSAARHQGARTIAVLLSGMLDDGSAGMLAVRRAGGTTMVQDPATCGFDSMPLNALAMGGVEQVVTVRRIASLLGTLTAPVAGEDA